MEHQRWTILLTLAVSVGFTTAAHAAIGAELLPLATVSASLATEDPCKMAPAMGPIPTQPLSKTAALLGGRSSQLDLIAVQQRHGTAAQLIPARTLASLAPTDTPGVSCPKTSAFVGALSPLRPLAYGRAKLDTGDFLQSKRLPVSRTHFDSDWNRVRAGQVSQHVVARFSGNSDKALLSSVNRWANANVRYAEDRDLYGKTDFWADAPTTLRRGAGDCEDIAIVKMQMLAAAGVPRSAMYLTIARDLVRNADHAMLVVKQGDRHWLLDNNTNEVLDASEGLDYRPIMSFSGGNKWLHGY